MRSLSPATSAKLFATGFSVGPVVDSLHNQCLLKYNMLPISLEWPSTSALPHFNDFPYFFCSSWTVPPLLGIAYVVLGGILPRVFEAILPSNKSDETIQPTLSSTSNDLRQRAFLAVVSTACIIKLSEYLELHAGVTDGIFASLSQADSHLVVMLLAAIGQWILLDGTLPALLAASITSLGGPLSELPFVSHGVWEYLDTAGDYLPLASFPTNLPGLTWLLGSDYSSLALSSITGPCYFAVTMDAIALGRWFDSSNSVEADLDS